MNILKYGALYRHSKRYLQLSSLKYKSKTRFWMVLGQFKYYDGVTLHQYMRYSNIQRKRRSGEKLTLFEKDEAKKIKKLVDDYNLKLVKTFSPSAKLHESVSQGMSFGTRQRIMLDYYQSGKTLFSKNDYLVDYLGFKTKMKVFTWIGLLFGLFMLVNYLTVLYDRYFRASGHNLLRKSFYYIEQSDIMKKMSFDVDVSKFPTNMSRTLKNIPIFGSYTWKWIKETQEAEIMYDLKLYQLSETGKDIKTYPARVQLKAHLQDNISPVGEINQLQKACAALTLVFQVVLACSFFLLTIDKKRKVPKFTSWNKMSLCQSMKSSFYPLIFLLLGSFGLLDAIANIRFVGMCDENFEASTGVALTNKDPLIHELDEKMNDKFSQSKFGHLLSFLAVRIFAPLDNSFETLSRRGNWNIDSMIMTISIEDDTKTIWIIEPK